MRYHAITITPNTAADLCGGMVSMYLDMAAEADPSNPANSVADDEIQERYAERNRCIWMALAFAAGAGWSCGVKIDPIEADWPIVFIDLPTGQVSWHMPAYPRDWDGHTVEQKYDRVREWSNHATAAFVADEDAGVAPGQ